MDSNLELSELPAWGKTLMQKYGDGIAHAFILHFNTADYVTPGVTLRPWLQSLLSECEIIACYNRAEGITFPLPSMKDKALTLLGLAQQAPAADPFAAALSNLPGGAASRPAAGEIPKAPAQALPLLEQLLRTTAATKKRVAVVIDYAETLVPDGKASMMTPEDRTNVVLLERWGHDAELSKIGNPIILLTRTLSELHSSIRAASSKYESIMVPLPDRDARLNYIKQFHVGRPELFSGDIDTLAMANSTAGLGLVHIEDIFLRADSEGQLSWDLIRERKRDIIASEYEEVLTIFDPTFGFEAIGGHEHVKRFFREDVIAPMRSGDTQYAPQGVLMLGPAGTGKTAFAKAVAYEANLNYVLINSEKLFGGIVGESEQKTAKALAAIESLAPTIVFVDEIDQVINRSSGGGDSGTSARVFQKFLDYMSRTSNRGKVLFMAATNRPDLMDAAIRREGRFDAKVPFLAPVDEERRAILEVMTRRYGIEGAEISEQLIKRTNNWTGAVLETLAVKAARLVRSQRATLENCLIEAAKLIRPSTSAIEEMTRLALREVNDADLLPPAYVDLWTSTLDDTMEDQPATAAPQPLTRGKRTL